MVRELKTEDQRLFPEISSKDNPRLKHVRAVRDGRSQDEIFIEGLRLVEEAVKADLLITNYFYTPEFAASARNTELLSKLDSKHGAVISTKLLESIAETKSPQGIIVLAQKPETGKNVLKIEIEAVKDPISFDKRDFFNPRPLLTFSQFPLIVLHKLNNPLNVGAILRTAEAAGCAGAILTQNTADPFSPKSLRSAMGSAFRLPLWTNANFCEAIEFCHKHQIKTACAALSAAKMHSEIDWTISRAIVIGSEAHGLTPEEIALAEDSFRIPMHSSVESLNAAVACGIVLYEAARQRGRSDMFK